MTKDELEIFFPYKAEYKCHLAGYEFIEQLKWLRMTFGDILSSTRLETWAFCYFDGYFYFKNEDDLIAYKLKFG